MLVTVGLEVWVIENGSEKGLLMDENYGRNEKWEKLKKKWIL